MIFPAGDRITLGQYLLVLPRLFTYGARNPSDKITHAERSQIKIRGATQSQRLNYENVITLQKIDKLLNIEIYMRMIVLFNKGKSHDFIQIY